MRLKVGGHIIFVKKTIQNFQEAFVVDVHYLNLPPILLESNRGVAVVEA